MILVILAVCIALFIGGILLESSCSNLDFLGVGMSTLGFLVGAIALIVTIVLVINVSKLRVIDEKIEMYHEENVKIEEQIAAVVKDYQKYEADIFTETSSDSAITLVALYPELKADELVKSQIDVYVTNNKRIIDLKEKKITSTVSRWWLYFGK